MSWYKLTNKTGSDPEKGEDIDILMMGEIGWPEEYGGVTARKFITDVRALKPKSLKVTISSPGGYVHEGLAIYNFLRAMPNVTTHAVGLVGSIASVIWQAGGKRTMAANSMALVHEASGGAWGGAEEMEKAAREIRKINSIITSIYVSRGSDPEAIVKAMEADELLTPDEALALGLVDEITEDQSFSAYVDREKVKARWGENALAHLDTLAHKSSKNMGLFSKPKGPTEREVALAKAIQSLGYNPDEIKDPDKFCSVVETDVQAQFKEDISNAKADGYKSALDAIAKALEVNAKDVTELVVKIGEKVKSEVSAEVAKLTAGTGVPSGKINVPNDNQPALKGIALAAKMIADQEKGTK